MSLILEKQLVSAPARVERPPSHDARERLTISVIFTSVEATLCALRKAAGLASRLHATIVLLVPQIVPYPLPLSSPPVLLDFNERRFRLIAEESTVETSVRLYLCRDLHETLRNILPRHSLIVLAGPKRWWPTAESRLARGLGRYPFFITSSCFLYDFFTLYSLTSSCRAKICEKTLSAPATSRRFQYRGRWKYGPVNARAGSYHEVRECTCNAPPDSGGR